MSNTGRPSSGRATDTECQKNNNSTGECRKEKTHGCILLRCIPAFAPRIYNIYVIKYDNYLFTLSGTLTILRQQNRTVDVMTRY